MKNFTEPKIVYLTKEQRERLQQLSNKRSRRAYTSVNSLIREGVDLVVDSRRVRASAKRRMG